MPEGIIVKGYSSFYYVQSESQIWECSLRGRLRLNAQDFLPGDRVRVTVLKGTRGVIEEVLPRSNSLIRPPVSNVNQAVIILALCSPAPDLNLLDRLLIQVEEAKVDPVICFNKVDLVSNPDAHAVSHLYREIGYRVIETSTKSGLGLTELRQVLKDKVSVFAGPSGVGKSTLLNAVQPGLELKTGRVSDRLRRGRHTTRHVELIPLENGGLVADTPGFSALNLPKMKREELPSYFPEMEEQAKHCRFSSCIHWQEPQCGVKDALERGLINHNRYKNYLAFLAEVIEHERRY